MKWIMYQQLGEHMWYDQRPTDLHGKYVKDETKISDVSWERRMNKARECGANTVLIDLAEGLRYPTHPELAVKGSWDAQKMRDWVVRLRGMGMEAIPMLNFAAGHDEWLGEYSRMLSTPAYYRVCRDLIRDAYEIFDKPSHIHIGMDEEDEDHYRRLSYWCLRQGELYWHDVNFLIGEVERLGARAVMAADKIWWGSAEYIKHIPRSVLQQNWYYGVEFDVTKLKKPNNIYVKAYRVLEEAGYDQIPNASNYLEMSDPDLAAKYGKRGTQTDNLPGTIRHALKTISKERLKGFVMAPWCGISEKKDPVYFEACENLAEGKALYEKLVGAWAG